MTITQLDIAKKLNVSRITVSKALRDHPDISVAMKAKVKETASEMGYTPNLIAKQLKENKSNTIGIVVPGLENSFFAYAIDSIIDGANSKGYNAIVTVSRENEDIELQNIQNLMGMRVDGLLVCVSQLTTNPAIFQTVKNMNVPLVFFDRELPGLGFSSVVFDDEKGAEEALGEIISFGYKKIAHLAGYSDISIGKKRIEGYKSALKKNDIEIDEKMIIEAGFGIKDGYDSFMQLYEQNDLPEVIFAVNDRVALGAYQAIQSLNLKIPNDIGVVGYGYNKNALSLTPSLAVIDQNPREMGRKAVNLLLNEIANPENNKKQIVINEGFRWNESLKK